MKSLQILSAICFLLISINARADSIISDTEIKDMLSSMQKSVNNKNIETFFSYFTEDATIVFNMPIGLDGAMAADVNRYKKILDARWAMRTGFSYEILAETYNISEDGKYAEAKNIFRETAVYSGHFKTSKTVEEKISIVEVNGSPKISYLYIKDQTSK